MNAEEFEKEYAAQLHAIQTGVELERHYDSAVVDAKHLRTGINGALVLQSALARLLIEKGVFTEDEYYQGVLRALRDEVKSYEARLSQRLGAQITLA